MVWERVGRVLSLIAGAVLLFVTLLIVADVLSRWLLGKSISGATESTELFLPYVVFFGFAYTLATGGHVRVTLIFGRLRGRLRLWAEILACVSGLFLCGPLLYFSWLHFWESFVIREYMEAAVKLPWWVGKLAMPTGLFVFFIQFLLLLGLNLARLRMEGPIETIK